MFWSAVLDIRLVSWRSPSTRSSRPRSSVLSFSLRRGGRRAARIYFRSELKGRRKPIKRFISYCAHRHSLSRRSFCCFLINEKPVKKFSPFHSRPPLARPCSPSLSYALHVPSLPQTPIFHPSVGHGSSGTKMSSHFFCPSPRALHSIDQRFSHLSVIAPPATTTKHRDFTEHRFRFTKYFSPLPRRNRRGVFKNGERNRKKKKN